MENISKEDFLKSYNKYKTNKFSKFMLKTFLRDPKMNGYKLSIIIEFFLFNILTVIMMQTHNMHYAKIFTVIGNGIFFLFGLFMLVAVIIDQNSTKKMLKDLNITLDELNFYSQIYFTN
jgi:uncharacterized membrane protein